MAVTIGQTVALAKGKQVVRNGVRTRLRTSTEVTVRKIEPARDGKVRIYWKSNGYPASALL